MRRNTPEQIKKITSIFRSKKRNVKIYYTTKNVDSWYARKSKNILHLLRYNATINLNNWAEHIYCTLRKPKYITADYKEKTISE